MVKYLKKDVSICFEEIPDKISLGISISNCQGNCEGCHSPWLRENVGEELTEEVLDSLIKENYGINCILFLGEGNDHNRLIELAKHIRNKYGKEMSLALYSGRNDVEDDIWDIFDYIKIGSYIKQYGSLNKETTNQRLYWRSLSFTDSDAVLVNEKTKLKVKDITYKFWKR